MFIHRKTQHFEHVNSPQTSLWIQCNPNKFPELIKLVFFFIKLDNKEYMAAPRAKK